MRNIERLLREPGRPQPAPVEYAGKWVAWNSQETEIVGSGVTAKEAYAMATEAGYEDVVLQRVRRIDQVFIGGTRS
jgi:hypothetical protein